MHAIDRLLSGDFFGKISRFFRVAIVVTFVFNALILARLVFGDNSRDDGAIKHFDWRPEPANLKVAGGI